MVGRGKSLLVGVLELCADSHNVGLSDTLWLLCCRESRENGKRCPKESPGDRKVCRLVFAGLLADDELWRREKTADIYPRADFLVGC
jgi:hypothetical protein